jgi:hypothetical protein
MSSDINTELLDYVIKNINLQGLRSMVDGSLDAMNESPNFTDWDSKDLEALAFAINLLYLLSEEHLDILDLKRSMQ